MPRDPAPALLSRSELIQALSAPRAADRLIVTPLLEPEIQSGTLDVRLGTKFVVGRRARQISFNPLKVDERAARRLQDAYDLPFSVPFILHPNSLVLACTLEYLSLPRTLAASVVTRSSYGRVGLISATAIHVHPGYKGCLTFELLNLGPVPIELYPGTRIAQLVFTRAGVDDLPHQAKYSLATKPEFPRMWLEPERELLPKVIEMMRIERAEEDF